MDHLLLAYGSGSEDAADTEHSDCPVGTSAPTELARKRKRSRYSSADTSTSAVSDAECTPTSEVEHLQRIHTNLWDAIECLRVIPSAEDVILRREAIETLCELLTSKEVSEEGAGVARCQVFGSTAMGLCLRESDVDLNLWLPIRCSAVFLRLRKALLKLTPPVSCTVKRGALVPVAQFVLRGIAFDVTHQCGAAGDLAVEPAHSQAVIEWITCWLRPEASSAATAGLVGVVRILKLWARRRGIDRSFVGYLPSLAYLVLLCYVLRVRCPAMCVPRPLTSVEQVRVLLEFFRFYGDEWQPTSHVIVAGFPAHTSLAERPAWARAPSIDDATEQETTERCCGSTSQSTQRGRLNTVGLETVARVLDPVDPTVNLARFLTYRTLEKLRAAMRDALDALSTSKSPQELTGKLFGK